MLKPQPKAKLTHEIHGERSVRERERERGDMRESEEGSFMREMQLRWERGERRAMSKMGGTGDRAEKREIFSIK